ncbi:MAG: diguanylate cyclase [Woeseiaceae bacterium]|nr:diguanylate cyclase [Woeseiaceae bacterium]
MPYLNYYSKVEPKVWIRRILLPEKASEEEQEFRRYFQRRTVPMAQIAVLIGFALVSGVCVLDWLLMPVEFSIPVIKLRAVTMLGVLAIVFALSLARPADPRLPYAFMAAGAIVGSATVVVGAIAAMSGTQFVVWGTIFTTFYVYLVLGLRFRQATIAGWPVFLTFLAVGIMFDAPVSKMAYGTLFLLFANLIGMYACFLFELDSRELFHKKKLLNDLARSDGLTGIDNRRSFDEHLDKVWKQARRESQSVAILLIDIDYFKLYNDCYGHRPGDNVIQAVADSLATHEHRPLDRVARYGGEEFVVVLYGPTEQYVRDYASRIVAEVAALEIEHKASDAANVVTVSVGAALAWPHEVERSEQVIRGADDALYQSKAMGRNRSTFYSLDEPVRLAHARA